MSEKVTAMIEEIKGLTVLELSELVHALEEEFGLFSTTPGRTSEPEIRSTGKSDAQGTEY